MRFFILSILLVCLPALAFAQNKGSDKRAAGHFTPEELAAIEKDPVKLKKLNYLFNSSFIFVPSDSTNATPVDPATIDIMKYDFHRFQDKPRTIFINRMHDKIILQSKDDLEKAYREIESQN